MFNSDVEILNFGPKATRRWSQSQYLLFPARAYRVTAPRIRSRTLNPLQKAVAMLVRTGLLDANEIGPKLYINEDLANHILHELLQSGYITQSGLSENGLKALQNDSVLSYEWVSGFVFQNPWTGKLLPRFVEDLEFCEHSLSNGRPILHLGTEGKPYNPRPVWLNHPSDLQVAPPAPEDVLHAIQRQSRQKRSGRKSTYSDEGSELEIETKIAGVKINQITEIDPKVRSVYLTTIVYLAEEARSDGEITNAPPEWFVADPFGHAEIPELYATVREYSETDSNLQKSINRMLERAGYKPGYTGMREWEDRAVEEAHDRIRKAFTNSIDGFQGVAKELIAFEARYLIARDLPERCDGLPGALRKVWESIFIWCINAHSPGDIWKRVYRKEWDKKRRQRNWKPLPCRYDCQKVYEDAARELGLTPTQPFLNTKPGTLQSAIRYGRHSSLTAFICGQIMYAAEADEHPLQRVSKEIPNLLERLETITSEGGKDVHVDKKKFTLEQCKGLRSDCFSVVASMLQLPFHHSEKNS